MVEVCLSVKLALACHLGPRAKAIGRIWLPILKYDLEAHLGHIITCMYNDCLYCVDNEGFSNN